MRQRRVKRDVWALVGFVILAACAAYAPASRAAGPMATIRGVVSDPTGAVLPGVTVSAVATDTGLKRETLTNAKGEYTLFMPAGPVELKAELTGFKSVTVRLAPHSGQVLVRDLRLEIGALTETIEVVAAGSMVNTMSAGYVAKRRDGLAAVRRPSAPPHREGYEFRADNDFLEVASSPLSTFSVDVDRASYSNVRRFLNEGDRPPVDAVRIEEMVNYFPYDYAAPRDGAPLAAHLELAPAPWKPEHLLLRVGLKAREIVRADRPPSNLVFLIDVSGSMNEPNKLPLVQRALGLLVEQLDARDRVSVVVYAGAAGMVLPPTAGDQKTAILKAIDRLSAGGSTNGGEGIRLAYDLAIENRIEGGVNRVILATDGDFNVGVSDQGSLVRLVQQKAKKGVFLSVLGFGMGNYQDGMLEALADKGDGHYAYIDTFSEARKAFIDELTSTLVTVAKDVKIQIEFNPARVRAYRLIGYENRLLKDEDFGDDAKDAGEVGAGHAVTALYELVPAGGAAPARDVDPLVYSRPRDMAAAARSAEWLRLKLRYKKPEGGRSQKLEWAFADEARAPEDASADFQFAAAVAGFGMLLRESPHKGAVTPEMVLGLGERGRGPDGHQYRAEFLELVREARDSLAGRSASAR